MSAALGAQPERARRGVRAAHRGAVRRGRLHPGETVLDIGCGSGATALIAAEAVGSAGRVVAADLSDPLLAVARSRPVPAGAAPIDWIAADAETRDFAAGRFDRAISRFGVMFFADSRAAFANIRRPWRRGGA